MDEKQLLREEEIFPSDAVIAAALKDAFPAYQTFVEGLPAMQIGIEWRYYRDGKSWLAKGAFRRGCHQAKDGGRADRGQARRAFGGYIRRNATR